MGGLGSPPIMKRRLGRMPSRALGFAAAHPTCSAPKLGHTAFQQAEKALKAAFSHLRAEEPPWNHQLAKIAERVAERGEGLPDAVASAVTRLEPFLEQARYPSGDVRDPIPADLVGEREAKAAIERAEEVLAWVSELLRRPPQRAQRERS